MTGVFFVTGMPLMTGVPVVAGMTVVIVMHGVRVRMTVHVHNNQNTPWGYSHGDGECERPESFDSGLSRMG